MNAQLPVKLREARPDQQAACPAACTPLQQMRCTRRSMLRTGFWAAAGTTLGGLGLGFVNFVWPRRVARAGGVFSVQAADVPRPGDPPRLFPSGRFYLVNLKPGGGVPAGFGSTLAASERGGLLALAQKCPHLGCAVPWRGDFVYEGVEGWFRCPCHMSTYTASGLRVYGPAPRPMDTFALRVNRDGSVAVDTGLVKKGGPDNPQRAVGLGSTAWRSR